MEDGKGVKRDYGKAIEFLSQACDLNNAYACNNLGVSYYGGKGVKKIIKRHLSFILRLVI
ncbi:tetratricopeptide repeat protein [Helicobacter rodentium]|uniref:tetratricopeptide repeat protein n=1 Tax=Helicobacter rodentium TaxID=59617 RepID=UPI0025A5B449|nr:hypothetical protein [Helicobacter rodentium]